MHQPFNRFILTSQQQQQTHYLCSPFSPLLRHSPDVHLHCRVFPPANALQPLQSFGLWRQKAPKWVNHLQKKAMRGQQTKGTRRPAVTVGPASRSTPRTSLAGSSPSPPVPAPSLPQSMPDSRSSSVLSGLPASSFACSRVYTKSQAW